MNLLCAVCIYERTTHWPGRGPLVPKAAITILNGQAVCEEHFGKVYGKVDNGGGQVAIALLKHPGFDSYPPSDQGQST